MRYEIWDVAKTVRDNEQCIFFVFVNIKLLVLRFISSLALAIIRIIFVLCQLAFEFDETLDGIYINKYIKKQACLLFFE